MYPLTLKDSVGDEEEGPPSSSPQQPTQEIGDQSPEVGDDAVTGGSGAPALLESRPQARVLPSARATGSENGGPPMRPSKVMN